MLKGSLLRRSRRRARDSRIQATMQSLRAVQHTGLNAFSFSLYRKFFVRMLGAVERGIPFSENESLSSCVS